MTQQMTTQEAIVHLTNKNQGSQRLTMYAIAKAIKISPIMVGHYKYGRSKMGLTTAKVFEEQFGIQITDASSPGRQANDS